KLNVTELTSTPNSLLSQDEFGPEALAVNYCYEQRLLLRVIKADGSVIPINYENATEIQDINYCSVTPLAKHP
ncbi:36807_t:CDS:2, partial [Gigaspora margarita]